MDTETRPIILSLGSNLGDRHRTLEAAIAALGDLDETRVRVVSSVYECEPWGMTAQASFLNTAAEIETALTPRELLHAIQAIERRLGREPGPKWGPRAIDIDIVLWGNLELNTPELTIPHPEFRRRAFVLQPMCEIAANALDPVSGMTVAELAHRPEATGKCAKVC